MLQKFQDALMQTPNTPLLIKHNILISIVGLSWSASIRFSYQLFYTKELLFLYSKYIAMKVLLLDQAILSELFAL